MTDVFVAINYWLGVVLSLVGSVAVAPQAVGDLGRVFWKDARWAHGQLARVLPFLRKSVETRGVSAVSSGFATGWAVAGGSSRVVDKSSVEAQFEAVWKEIDAVRGEVDGLRQESRQRADTIEKNMGDLERRVQERHQQLVERMDRAEAMQTQFNATALPLVGFGIVLTASAEPLAQWSVIANIVVLILVLFISVRVLVRIAGLMAPKTP